jgi:probable F420-dependent oxidoreductase
VEIGAQYMGDPGGPKAFAVRAEAAGFDSVWCGDHVGHIVDGLATLGCFAGATERITIGVNVIVVPYRPAAIVAKALSTIALVAPGRVIAGFGVGGEFPGEFTATGADLHARGAATDEALQAIRALWTGRPVTFDGRWVTLEAFQIEPPPDPPPTVWIGGRSDAALRRAVRFGDGYAPYLVSPQQLRQRRERLAELAAQAGRRAGELTIGALVTMIPGPSVDEAVELGLSSLRLSGLTPDSVRAQYLLGDDESILARLQEYADAGVDHLILGCLPGDDRLVDDFFEACGRIVPAARALCPAPR